MKYYLIDHMDYGINKLTCSCGQELHPDCDMSLASINETFEDHLKATHGVQRTRVSPQSKEENISALHVGEILR